MPHSSLTSVGLLCIFKRKIFPRFAGIGCLTVRSQSWEEYQTQKQNLNIIPGNGINKAKVHVTYIVVVLIVSVLPDIVTWDKAIVMLNKTNA